MAGCGLGALVFGPVNMPEPGILAATTNATFGSQTFGITSGTSNCVSGGVVAAGHEQAAFAEVTFDDLKRDMAAGGGEFLSSFATLLGCEPAARPELARMTQAYYADLLPLGVDHADRTGRSRQERDRRRPRARRQLQRRTCDGALARKDGKVVYWRDRFGRGSVDWALTDGIRRARVRSSALVGVAGRVGN